MDTGNYCQDRKSSQWGLCRRLNELITETVTDKAWKYDERKQMVKRNLVKIMKYVFAF